MQKAATTKAPAATDKAATPTNYRRKRRHSEPHLQATKPYKNFVTHWKLDTKKPAQPAPVAAPPPHTQPEHHTHQNTAGNWSPSTSEALKSFQQYKKDSPSNSRASGPPPSRGQNQQQQQQQQQQQPPTRWVRRGSLPHLYDSNVASQLSGLAHNAIMEEPEVPEINFPPSHTEYRFPPITLNFPPPPQDILFRSQDDLAPFLAGKRNQETRDRNLPSLHSILALQDVSLQDDEKDEEMQEEPPRSYTVRRRMSIDSLMD